MKAILKLQPITEPKEGMKVVTSKEKGGSLLIYDLLQIEGNEVLVKLDNHKQWTFLYTVNQIVGEYEKVLTPVVEDNFRMKGSDIIQLPVSVQDWQYILDNNLIGKEVEVHQVIHDGSTNIFSVNQHFVLKQEKVVYTKEDMKQAYEEGCRIASPFGNQGLSKHEKANWPIWIQNYKKK